MQRESFKSRLGFLLVSAGCAIGIGNVWRFPYVAGENGGGLFCALLPDLSGNYGAPGFKQWSLQSDVRAARVRCLDTRHSKSPAANGISTAGLPWLDAIC